MHHPRDHEIGKKGSSPCQSAPIGDLQAPAPWALQQSHSALFKLNNQLSTGRRVLTPQDDPVAAAQALVVTQSKEVNQQYINNRGRPNTNWRWSTAS